jgi:hypothetical protein
MLHIHWAMLYSKFGNAYDNFLVLHFFKNDVNQHGQYKCVPMVTTILVPCANIIEFISNVLMSKINIRPFLFPFGINRYLINFDVSCHPQNVHQGDCHLQTLFTIYCTKIRFWIIVRTL